MFFNVISHRKGGRIKSDELGNRDEATTALKDQIILKVYMPDWCRSMANPYQSNK